MQKFEFLIDAENAGKRIDLFLVAQRKEQSRSYLQKLLKEGKVLTEGKPVNSHYKLRAGDRVELELPDAVELAVEARPMELDVLYEDADVILINKPKGMVVHPAAGHADDTLVNGLLHHCQGELSGINGVLRPGIVHRIDKDTTGVLVVCKNDRAHTCLAEQLKEHSITRRYEAVVHGVIRQDEGTIDAPIGRSERDRLKMAVNQKNGKRAVTHFQVRERYRDFTWICCRLETGRTHQIRVHMSHIGHPLLGDGLYGPAKAPFALDGQTLHAALLGFLHPSTGQYVEFEAPLPAYFSELLEKLRRR
jgi:23S rRNA pseudouridine1911/1915/1917 synthase